MSYLIEATRSNGRIISTDTSEPVVVIPRLLRSLKRFPFATNIHSRLDRRFTAVLANGADPELLDELVETICDEMTNRCPVGFYVGASPEDAETFGIWPTNEQREDDTDDYE